MPLFDEIRRELLSLADPAYRDFSCRLIPGDTFIMGVRKPQLHRIAHRLARHDWKEYFYAVCNDSACEEKMLAALTLRYARPKGFDELLSCIGHYIPLINNWAVCDTFCDCLRFTPNELPAFKRFLTQFVPQCNGVYDRRFAAVFALKFCAKEPHTSYCLTLLQSLQTPDYYVRMTIAWGLAECCVFAPKKTEQALLSGKFDVWIARAALRKIGESFRIPHEIKSHMRALRSRLS